MQNEVEEQNPISEQMSEETEKNEKIALQSHKLEIDNFHVGDVVVVGNRIQEEGGSRIQNFEGIVIAIKGSGISKTFTVRKIGVTDIGVERIFPIHSPNVVSIKIKKENRVRRSKLYYLRQDKRKTSLAV